MLPDERPERGADQREGGGAAGDAAGDERSRA